MRRGPAPKPNRLKILAGNPGRRPLNDDEPQPKFVTRLNAPVELDSDGQKFWRYYATLLKRIRVLSEADIHALAAACDGRVEEWFDASHRSKRRSRQAVSWHCQTGVLAMLGDHVVVRFESKAIEQSCEQFRRTLVMIGPGNFSREGFSHERRRFRS